MRICRISWRQTKIKRQQGGKEHCTLLGFWFAVGILQFYYCVYLFNISTLGKSVLFVPVPVGQPYCSTVTLTWQTDNFTTGINVCINFSWYCTVTNMDIKLKRKEKFMTKKYLLFCGFVKVGLGLHILKL